MRDAPEQPYPILRRWIPSSWQPWIRGVRRSWRLRSMQLEEPYRTVFPFSQATQARQRNIVRLAELVERDAIAGAIVECGVLDGGMAALMAQATGGSGRPVHLFDCWRGLPNVTEEDGAVAEKWVGQAVGSIKRVKTVMQRLGVDPRRLHFHEGLFEDTFPKATIDAIALLHIDCDFYEPTRLCLDRWYDHVTPGGYVQFDDYAAFVGCRRAVDEFLDAHPGVELEETGERGAAFHIRKPED